MCYSIFHHSVSRVPYWLGGDFGSVMQTTETEKERKYISITRFHCQKQTFTLVKKHYVILSGEEVHHAHHEADGATSCAQRVHPKLIEKIYELVSEGITEVQEVKRA